MTDAFLIHKTMMELDITEGDFTLDDKLYHYKYVSINKFYFHRVDGTVCSYMVIKPFRNLPASFTE